jgi:hypothetical protein
VTADHDEPGAARLRVRDEAEACPSISWCSAGEPMTSAPRPRRWRREARKRAAAAPEVITSAGVAGMPIVVSLAASSSRELCGSLVKNKTRVPRPRGLAVASAAPSMG